MGAQVHKFLLKPAVARTDQTFVWTTSCQPDGLGEVGRLTRGGLSFGLHASVECGLRHVTTNW